ncbi:hypothetical protein SELMODRAFT_413889 [Selaginella moellendorffii]|uniref:Uncharacterized protein n=1 Tax=Selaginella moellendorffii TaxID=88036 RepID=D8RQY6_SELML|nr:hypothetical protein SELMODRAFT_413889 [Selaginella moellendorffii]
MPRPVLPLPSATAAVPSAAAAKCPGRAFSQALHLGRPWQAGMPANRRLLQVPAQSAWAGTLVNRHPCQVPGLGTPRGPPKVLGEMKTTTKGEGRWIKEKTSGRRDPG